MDGYTALMYAAANGHTDCLQLLLGEILMQNNAGKTAIYCTCYWGEAECVKYLLDESEIASKEGRAPLEVTQRSADEDECFEEEWKK